MADTPNNDSTHPLDESSDRGYHPLKHLDESLFPNNSGDFASSFMQPRGSASRLHNRPPAANPPPWEDPDQAWRYADGRLYTGEAFIYSRRTQPETRAEMVNQQHSGDFPAAAVPKDHSQTQVPGGLHGFGGLGFTRQTQPPEVRDAGLASHNLVGAFNRIRQGSAAPPQDIAKDSSSLNKGQFVFTGWNDDAKRELYMWKVKRKKGYAFFLHIFPGETAESLHEAFKKYKDDGERLYNA